MEDPGGSIRLYMLGREPMLSRDGRPISDARGRRSSVTSATRGLPQGMTPGSSSDRSALEHRVA